MPYKFNPFTGTFDFFATEFTTVTSFGADSTGATDSTEAFKKALEASSKTVRVPAGTYLIEGTLDVTNKTLVGDGMGRSILTKNGTSSAMLTVKPVEESNTTIKGLTLTNSNHAATEGSYIKVEAATETLQAPTKIEDIETKYAFHGLEFGLCLVPQVSRIYQYKWKGNAAWFHSGANGAMFSQFVFQEGTNTSVGIRMEGKNPAHIFENGEIFVCGIGVYATIEGGSFENHQPEHCRFTDVFVDTARGKFETKSVATVTEGSALVKMTVARSGINVGNTVEGAGVPGGTTISEIKLATNEIKLSANIEAGKSGTPTLTFTGGTSTEGCWVLTQCLDTFIENCYGATGEAIAKVVAFLISTCEATALTNCVAFQQYYMGYYIFGCTGTSLVGCIAIRGATGLEFAGNKVGQVTIAGGSGTSVVGGMYLKSKQYGFVLTATAKQLEVNSSVIEGSSKGELLNEATVANQATIYFRAAGKEVTQARTEIKTWLEPANKVEENTSPAARLHAGNIELRGILKVKVGEKVEAGIAFMTIPIAFGTYRPAAIRRMRLAYGKEGEAPDDFWVEVKGNGEILPLAGSKPIEAEELIYLDEAFYPLLGA